LNSKKPVLFIGEAVSLAHVTRPLVLAKSLDAQEYEIHFACDPRYESLVGAVPHIQYWPIRSIPSKTFVKAADRGGLVLQEKDIESYVIQELALFRKIHPFLVINDFRFSVSISAELSQITYATLANVHWSPYRILGFDPTPEMASRPSGKRIFNRLMPRKQRSATASFNSVRKSHGLALLKGYVDLATRGDYTLYTEPPGFIQTMPLPDDHIFLGPILWSPDIPNPSWWQTWDPNLPLIYVTLGSTGIAKRLPEIVHVLSELPATIVVATAGRVQLNNKPANVYAADYLPGMEICRQASVVVCNGGSATAYQALSQGTPVVGIWSNIDQYLTMMTVERAGAGYCYSAAKYDSRNIQRIISTVLQDARYRTNAGQIAESFRLFDAGQRFQKFVHEIPNQTTQGINDSRSSQGE
jgi:UDP:flavonoid glycosyltransferase YjiC (YdhE family)